MIKHPFFGIQNDSSETNPPLHKVVQVRYQQGPQAQPMLGISMADLRPSHNFGSLAEAEDWYIAQLVQHASRVQVFQLMGALGIVIGRMGSKVASQCRRGAANTVLINDAFVPEFKQACNEVISTFNEDNTGATRGRFTNIGAIIGMNVWASPAVPRDRIVVLYRSFSEVNQDNDVGAVFTENAHGNWLSVQQNFADYAAVVEL